MNFKKYVSILLLASFFSPRVAFAQSVPSPDAPPAKSNPGDIDTEKLLSPLRKGQAAPFTGILLSPPAAADVIVGIETFQERIDIEVSNAVKKEQNECEKKVLDERARLESEKKVVQAESDRKTRTIDSLNIELEKARSGQTNPVVWIGVGTLGGIVVTLLTVLTVSQATK